MGDDFPKRVGKKSRSTVVIRNWCVNLPASEMRNGTTGWLPADRANRKLEVVVSDKALLRQFTDALSVESTALIDGQLCCDSFRKRFTAHSVGKPADRSLNVWWGQRNLVSVADYRSASNWR